MRSAPEHRSRPAAASGDGIGHAGDNFQAQSGK